jgi:APA family basic amino acid/polyamine antiporter
MYFQVYVDPPGFSCPGVPLVPVISVFFNMVLFAQVRTALHVCFVLVSVTDFGTK